jgi:hypothetical protein
MLTMFSLVLGRPGPLRDTLHEAARAAATSELERETCYWRQVEPNIENSIAGA